MDTTNMALRRGISRTEVFRVWRSESDVSRKCDSVLNFVRENSDFYSVNENYQGAIIKTLKNVCGQLRQKWTKCHRSEKLFKNQYKSWLDGKITFSMLSSSSISRGRPTKPFGECSESVKRRKVRPIIEDASPEELSFATRMSLRSRGRRDAADVIKQVTCYSPKRATKLKRCFTKSQAPTKMTQVEALALYVDTKMTKRQYTAIRKNAKIHRADIYPSYEQLLSAKKDCYPPDITLTETSAEVKLQSLVDHTIKRLLHIQSEVLAQIDCNCTDLKILFKWGSDGAAGQSRYKQHFTSENDDDSFLFSICLVPLQLLAKTANDEIIIWQNPSTSSTKYCRPIKIIFKKETREFVKREIDRVQAQIDDLCPYQAEVNGNQVTCTSVFSLTMIDGKICSWLTDTAGQCCHICGATPKTMNNIAAMRQRSVNEESLSFGISSLHAWIKVLECILHIAYRLDIKKWQIRQSDKETVEAKKMQIQDKFRKEMGLLIDLPKPGFGSSNDGNTARRILQNPTLTSQITGVDENLISRLNVILITIACGYEIDSNLFENYCIETAELYIQKYNWYYMPQSLHKILIHGGKLINKAILPIGQMSEEAQEARNKDSKHFREFNSRKFSRVQTMEDMVHMLLISSDPLITSLRQKVPKKSTTLPREVLSMLKCPTMPSTETNESEEDESDE